MGRKSTVNRLPKAERIHPASKITIRPVQRKNDEMEVSLPQHATTSSRPVPTLDNESLYKILRNAGVPTTMRARGVNQQWRLVANQVLSRVSRIDVTRMFPNIPASANVQHVLNVLGHAETITIRDWPHTHVFPCIADELVIAELPKLREVELSGVHVSPKGIAQLIKKDSVRVLTLANHDSVNRAVTAAMEKFQKYIFGRDPRNLRRMRKYLLDRLMFKRVRCISGEAISSLTDHCVAQEIGVTGCLNVRDVTLSCQSLSVNRAQKIYESYSLTSCMNLKSVRVVMDMMSNDSKVLNLSQNPHLEYFEVIADFAQEHEEGTVLASDVRELNLSGCRELQEFYGHPSDPVIITFPRMETLILFGARKLRRSCIQQAFGLDRAEPILPRLTLLDLTSTMIDKLVLNGYPFLRSVNCSGCPYLDSLDVRACWSLRVFNVRGKRAPLSNVNLILPVACQIDGKREAWSWQMEASHQSFSFP